MYHISYNWGNLCGISRDDTEWLHKCIYLNPSLASDYALDLMDNHELCSQCSAKISTLELLAHADL